MPLLLIHARFDGSSQSKDVPHQRIHRWPGSEYPKRCLPRILQETCPKEFTTVDLLHEFQRWISPKMRIDGRAQESWKLFPSLTKDSSRSSPLLCRQLPACHLGSSIDKALTQLSGMSNKAFHTINQGTGMDGL